MLQHMVLDWPVVVVDIWLSDFSKCKSSAHFLNTQQNKNIYYQG